MGYNLSIDGLPENEYPQLGAYKGSFDNMIQLKVNYPTGKKDWFAFLADIATFVYWNTDTSDWAQITGTGMPVFTADFLTDFDTIDYHGLYSIIGDTPGLFQSTNTGEGIMYQMVLWKDRLLTRTIDLNANPTVYPEFNSDTDRIDALVQEVENLKVGTNYIMVYGTGTPTENADELASAQDMALTMPRYLGELPGETFYTFHLGQTFISSDNILYHKVLIPGRYLPDDNDDFAEEITEAQAKSTRTTIIVAPGVYTFGTALSVETEGVDIVSLTGNADVMLNGINVTANNVYLKGLNLETNIFSISNSNQTQKFENCIGKGDSSFCDTSGNKDSYFNSIAINCIGGDHSFGGCGDGTLECNGILINCIGGESSFGGGNATPGNFTGQATNCIGGIYSFGGGDGVESLTGVLKYCSITSGSFPGSGGNLLYCIAENLAVTNR